jgi:hypothetical protein
MNDMTEATKTEETEMSKRDIVLAEIEKGGATIDSLCKAADCKYASVMSILSMLRLMGKCAVKDVPVKNKDGNETLTYRIVSPKEWDQIKAEKHANAKKKAAPARTPEQVYEMAEKKVARCTTFLDNAKKRAETEKASQLDKLKLQKANIELQIANIELSDAKKNLPEKPVGAKTEATRSNPKKAEAATTKVKSA